MRWPFGRDAPDDGRRLRGDVTLDQKKRRVHAVRRQHVEQLRRRRRIRAIVIGEIDRRRAVAMRHAPGHAIGVQRVEHKRKRRRVRQRHHDRREPERRRRTSARRVCHNRSMRSSVAMRACSAPRSGCDGPARATRAETPTTPTPRTIANDPVHYAAVGASDGIGFGGSVPVLPVRSRLPAGTGYVYAPEATISEPTARPCSCRNRGLPGAVLSPAILALARDIGRNDIPGTFLDQIVPFIPGDGDARLDLRRRQRRQRDRAEHSGRPRRRRTSAGSSTTRCGNWAPISSSSSRRCAHARPTRASSP